MSQIPGKIPEKILELEIIFPFQKKVFCFCLFFFLISFREVAVSAPSSGLRYQIAESDCRFMIVYEFTLEF